MFAATFGGFWHERDLERAGGDLQHPRLSQNTPDMRARALEQRLGLIWDHAVGFAGCEIIRRIVGLSHVDDFESIAPLQRRAGCELKALRFARSLLNDRAAYRHVQEVVVAAAAVARA